ncbi:MAG: TonB-dependent receptor [Tannerella sp.]|nr:TonB-dependent receptor [Tannerella sp.]
MKSFLIITFCLCLFSLNAQQQITGIVKDSKDGSPVAFATAALLRPDSSAITGVMVNDSGKFVISGVAAGNYLLQVSFVGYDKQYRNVNVPLHIDLGEILLSKNENLLQEVVVSASSRVIQKSDRIIFQPTNQNLTKGRNSYELLQFTPLLRSGQSDRIEIIGKDGFELYINNRKTTMNQDEINAYLASLPADRIESIEVITDPGVTMRTAGLNQGIINLILKKNEANGMNGTLNVQDLQGRLNSQTGGLFVNYQHNNLNISANISASAINMKNNEISDFYFTLSNIHQHLDNDYKTSRRNLMGMLRADYQLSSNQTLGMAYSASYATTKTDRKDVIQFGHIREVTIDSTLQSLSNAQTPVVNQSLNFNYRLKTGKKGNLSVDVYYLHNDRRQTIENSTEYVNENAPFEQYRQRSEEPMKSYSGKIEYTHAFGQANILTVGTEVYRNTAESDFFYGNMRNQGIYESDPQKTNKYSYSESYLGAYTSYVRVWNPKFNSRIEIVGEYVESRGLQHVTSEVIERNDFDIVPSVSLQYQFSPAHRLSYNLSSMVARPGYYSMNPFRFWLSPTTYKEYNPDLKPAYLYNNTLNYTLKGRYTFILNYMYIDQCVNNFLIPVDDRYTKYINANYGSMQSMGVTFNWNQALFKNRASVNASLSGAYRTFKGAVESIVVDVKGFDWNTSVNANVRLSDKYKWSLTANFSYFSDLQLAQENSSDSYRFTIGLTKNFARNIALNIGIQNVLFNSLKRDKVDDNYRYSTILNMDTRQAYIALTIPFGNMKAKGASNRNAALSKIGNRLTE